MDIRNVTQFSEFLGNNGLSEIDIVFQQIVICMGDFSRACACHRREDKVRIYHRCNQLYHSSMSAALNHRIELISKVPERIINFYSDNGKLIGRLSR